jgi:hypothetical protein
MAAAAARAPSYAIVQSSTAVAPPTADWEAPGWAAAPRLSCARWGDVRQCDWHPETVECRLMTDEDHLAVLFRVSDELVQCKCSKYQDMVCNDSCVEFFVAPVATSVETTEYFNFEVNAAGTMLLYHCKGGTSFEPVAPEDGATIKMASSLVAPGTPILPSEASEPQPWVVEYHIPWALFAKYFGASSRGRHCHYA